jgi:hypothetical protein
MKNKRAVAHVGKEIADAFNMHGLPNTIVHDHAGDEDCTDGSCGPNPNYPTPAPDHIFNPSSICSCTVVFNGKACTISYCSMHRAAPEMLAALKSVDPCDVKSIARVKVQNAILKAEAQ